jgi:hypothetical protein
MEVDALTSIHVVVDHKAEWTFLAIVLGKDEKTQSRCLKVLVEIREPTYDVLRPVVGQRDRVPACTFGVLDLFGRLNRDDQGEESEDEEGETHCRWK